MKNIDDFFKSKLDKQGMAYDDAYWQAMEHLLDKEPKKKGFFIWRYVAAFLMGIAVCIIGFILIPSHDKNRMVANPTSKSMSTQTATSTTIQDTIALKNENGALGPTEKDNMKVTVAKSQFARPSFNKTNDASEILIGNTLAITETNKSEVQNTISIANEPLERLILKAWMPNHIAQFELETIAAITSFPKFTNGTLKQKDTNRIKRPWVYFMAIGSEYDKYSRSENKSLLKADEQTLNRTGYNLQFMAQKNSWGIKTGIGLLQFAERTNYQSINKSYSIDTVYRLVNPNYGLSPTGNTIALIKKQLDTTTTVWNTIANPNAIAQFTYLKIPLMVNYELGKKRFRFYIEAGLNTAILLKQKGYYTSFENNQYRVVDLKNNDLTKGVLFQSYTAFGFKYAIGKSLNLLGGYGFSKGLNSMVKGYQQKPNTQFFNLGLALKL